MKGNTQGSSLGGARKLEFKERVSSLDINTVNIVLTIISIILGILGIILTVIIWKYPKSSLGLREGDVIIWSILLLVTSYCLIFRMKSRKQIKALYEEITQKNEEVALLIINLSKGLKIIKNEVELIIDPRKKLYTFTFKKKFKVISMESPKKYRAQFYSSITKGGAMKETQEKGIEWKTLNVGARLAVTRNGALNLETIEVRVKPVTSHGSYIPFDIIFEYELNGRRRPINLSPESEFELTYFYNVSFEHWGSYLNRTLSCFGENASIKIYVEANITENTELILYKSLPTGFEEVQKKRPKYQSNNKVLYEFSIVGSPFQKYCVHWHELGFEGIKKSPLIRDESIVTDY